MKCEPIDELPHEIDLEELRQTDKPPSAAKEEKQSLGVPNFKTHVAREFNVLPLHENHYESLRTMLSLQENQYLRCKWDRFLDNVPKSYVKIQLYTDKTHLKQEARKMCLTGNFYGRDYKLAPVPFMEDPRQLEETNHMECKKSTKSQEK